MYSLPTQFKAALWCLSVVSSLFVTDASASYREDCRLVYQSTGKVYSVECIYVTGSELNQKTSSYSYSSFSLYVVVFWAEGEATVIKSKAINFCGFEAEDGCADSLLPIEGLDQEERAWKVCQPEHIFCR